MEESYSPWLERFDKIPCQNLPSGFTVFFICPSPWCYYLNLSGVALCCVSGRQASLSSLHWWNFPPGLHLQINSCNFLKVCPIQCTCLGVPFASHRQQHHHAGVISSNFSIFNILILFLSLLCLLQHPYFMHFCYFSKPPYVPFILFNEDKWFIHPHLPFIYSCCCWLF